MIDKFYTYIYYDPSRNNEPIYVGKGHGTRAWQHLTRRKRHPFIQRLQFMKRNNIKPVIGLYSGLDEEFSFLIEVELIAKFGRKDTGLGTLLNLTDGGEGNSNPSIQTRIKMGSANKGIKRTPEQNFKNSESRKGHPNGRKGIKFKQQDTNNHKNKGKIRTQEFKDNLSKLHSGKIAWNKGVTSARISCLHCGKMYDPGNFKKHINIIYKKENYNG